MNPAANKNNPTAFMWLSESLDVDIFCLVTCDCKTAKCFGEHVQVNPLAVRLRDFFDIKFGSGPVLCRGCMAVAAQFMTPTTVSFMAESRTETCLGYLKDSIISG